MFITLEGIDRSGKSTQAAMLAEALGEPLLLREPGGTEMGERARAMLKDPDLELDPVAELLLFCAARAELCARVIGPALAGGADVVCDRFIDSTAAYQGAGRALGIELVEGLNAIAIGDCTPDLTAAPAHRPGGGRARGQLRLAGGDEDGVGPLRGRGHRVSAPGRPRLRRARRPPPRPDRRSSMAEGDPPEVHGRISRPWMSAGGPPA